MSSYLILYYYIRISLQYLLFHRYIDLILRGRGSSETDTLGTKLLLLLLEN